MQKVFVNWQMLTLYAGGIIRRASHHPEIVEVWTNLSQVNYEIVPAAIVEPSVLETCVKIGIREFRKNSSHIRSALRCSSAIFGFVDQDIIMAILKRRDGYEPLAAKYIAKYEANLRNMTMNSADPAD